MIFCIRGAFCLTHDDEAHMTERIHFVMNTLLHQNAIKPSHIKSIFFTQTSDIQLTNVAFCLRKRQGYERIALFTSQEVSIQGMLSKTVRLMLIGEKLIHLKKICPVYMFGAEQLRPDLIA